MNRTWTDRCCGKRYPRPEEPVLGPRHESSHTECFLSRQCCRSKGEGVLGRWAGATGLQFSWRRVWTGKKHLQIMRCRCSLAFGGVCGLCPPVSPPSPTLPYWTWVGGRGGLGRGGAGLNIVAGSLYGTIAPGLVFFFFKCSVVSHFLPPHFRFRSHFTPWGPLKQKDPRRITKGFQTVCFKMPSKPQTEPSVLYCACWLAGCQLHRCVRTGAFCLRWGAQASIQHSQ